MNLLDKEKINAVASELNISPTFVEKDFYLIEVLKIFNNVKINKIDFIFAGGTSLSKGYGKIERFSEDIDFMIDTKKDFSRNQRRDILKEVLNEFKKSSYFEVIDKSIKKRDEYRHLSFDIDYQTYYKKHSSLRRNIKVELSLKPISYNPQNKVINSFIGELYKKPENLETKCMSLIETGANKLSALMWRVYVKDRTKELYSIKNDPTIIRHLYDLSSIKDEINSNKDFIKLLSQAYEKDKSRGKTSSDLSLNKFLLQTISKLKKDKEYKKEYTTFVKNMCYSDADKITSFETAIENLIKIIKS